MHRGYISLWRKTKNSPVWLMPPIYFRVWAWMLMSVNYESRQIPTTAGFINIEQGQRITSLRQIADEVSWYEYGTLKLPNIKTIKTVLEWLEDNGQCKVESNAKGTVITLINWDTYNLDVPSKVTQKEQLPKTDSLEIISNAKGTVSNGDISIGYAEIAPKKETGWDTNNNKQEIKTKRLAAKPSGEHQYFLKWWCYAYPIVTGKGYVLSGGKDGKIVSNILKAFDLKRAIAYATCFLTKEDEWIGSKRDLPMFQAQVNKLSLKDCDFDSCRDIGLIPPIGIDFSDWKFWENTNEEAI